VPPRAIEQGLAKLPVPVHHDVAVLQVAVRELVALQ
jgi:hypothetical protein